MGLTYREPRQNGHEGVTLAQLNMLTEQVTQEAIQRGLDPEKVEPKVRLTFGGKIKSIEFTIG